MARAALASLLAHVIAIVLFASATASAPRLRSAAAPNDEVVVALSPARIEHRRPRAARSAVAVEFARFELRMRGKRLPLRRGQGYYAPLSSWHANGVRYYRVAYAFVYPDGRSEFGVVPWPVRFAADADPFARRTPILLATPLPPPPADYLPPGTIGKALRAYFPRLQFEE
jgi:hypothetical protein